MSGKSSGKRTPSGRKKGVHNWNWAAYKNCSCKRPWLHCFVNGVLIPVITKFQNVTGCKRALKYDSVVHPLYILWWTALWSWLIVRCTLTGANKVSAATWWNVCLWEWINTDFVWDFVKVVVGPFIWKWDLIHILVKLISYEWLCNRPHLDSEMKVNSEMGYRHFENHRQLCEKIETGRST